MDKKEFAITTLPRQWRENTKNMHFTGARAAIQEAENCAFDLERMLPKWTTITDDPDTWPEDEQRVLHTVYRSRSIRTDACISVFYTIGAIRHWQGRSWRPLCSIDCPPIQENV